MSTAAILVLIVLGVLLLLLPAILKAVISAVRIARRLFNVIALGCIAWVVIHVITLVRATAGS